MVEPRCTLIRGTSRSKSLLDQAELNAVMAARRGGRSWSEIATRLNMTRQSAWERWNDLEEAATSDRP